MFGNLFGRNEEPVDVSDKVIKISKARCPQNHACPSVRVCPVGALKQKGYGLPHADMSKCVKCGKCINYCPMRAIYFE